MIIPEPANLSCARKNSKAYVILPNNILSEVNQISIYFEVS
jgi:hypothetical protein